MTRTHIVGATMIAIVLVGLAPTGTLAQVQNRTYRDAMGREVGRSVTDTKGHTTFYDNLGRNTGRATTRNGTTTTYDRMGRQTGTIGTSEALAGQYRTRSGYVVPRGRLGARWRGLPREGSNNHCLI